ncbi:MAG: hypothetical protein RLZZ04_3834 [Cyanobacteriota bacterium]
MSQTFILEYWNDDNWLVGRLKGIPGVFSQGQTLEELEENIRDAYQLMNMEAFVSWKNLAVSCIDMVLDMTSTSTQPLVKSRLSHAIPKSKTVCAV